MVKYWTKYGQQSNYATSGLRESRERVDTELKCLHDYPYALLDFIARIELPGGWCDDRQPIFPR